MSTDSAVAYSTTHCLPISSTKNIDSTDNLKGEIEILFIDRIFCLFVLDNRGFSSNQDDTFSSVLSTLAVTFKDIAGSSYFPRIPFKKISSSNFFLKTSSIIELIFFLFKADGSVENRIIRANHSSNNNTGGLNGTSEKRSFPTILDMPRKLDYSTLQSIAHQTGKRVWSMLIDLIEFSFELNRTMRSWNFDDEQRSRNR